MGSSAIKPRPPNALKSINLNLTSQHQIAPGNMDMEFQRITCSPFVTKYSGQTNQCRFCAVEGDEHASRYGAYIDNQLVCVASVYVQGKQAGGYVKFATLPEYQGQGVGSKVIPRTSSKNYKRIRRYFWCDARTTALGFYQGLRCRLKALNSKNQGLLLQDVGSVGKDFHCNLCISRISKHQFKLRKRIVEEIKGILQFG
ncbi:GNAT family N-acetyltransferase [Vibrio chagasii]|nr:GNAT family N-acetyltransferase [Vibrio chagasii]